MKNYHHALLKKHKKYKTIVNNIKRISDDSLRSIDDCLCITQITEA